MHFQDLEKQQNVKLHINKKKELVLEMNFIKKKQICKINKWRSYLLKNNNNNKKLTKFIHQWPNSYEQQQQHQKDRRPDSIKSKRKREM